MNEEPKFSRGDIWYYEPSIITETEGIISGNRPVLIISNNKFNKYSPTVNALPITSQYKFSPVHINVFVKYKSQIQCEQICTLNKCDLKEYITTISNNKMDEVERKLLYQLDLILINRKQKINGIVDVEI